MAHIETFIQSAWQHLRADRHKQAMDCAKKAHAINPSSPDVAHLFGVLASRDGKPEIALPLLQKAIDTGGKTAQRLRHMAEALLDAGYAQAALTPLHDAIKEFGESPDLLGLKSAMEIALEQWDNAAQSAQQAIDLNPGLMAWELNLSFAQLMQGNIEDGFKNATARPKNLSQGSKCPALNFASPSVIWLKSEQGLGDTLFYLRYVAPLVKKGWQFHLEAERKLIPLLQNTSLFLSVKEKNTCPKTELCLNLGDLPLMALQCGIHHIPQPLPLIPDRKLVEKYRQELARIGPAPYIAVTWRAGPKGSKQRAGVATMEKVIDPALLGGFLAGTHATIINLQRLPAPEEVRAFNQALGRKTADYSALNNNLSGMLALMSVVDDYFTVSNTNLHLREGLAKPSHVFVNRPFQDWRWQAEGDQSIWYPHSQVCRQQKDKGWGQALANLTQKLSQTTLSEDAVDKSNRSSNDDLRQIELNNTSANKCAQLLREGWSVVASNIPLALSKAQAVLSENPENPHALHLLGWAAVQDLKFEIAESVLQRAVDLAPDSGDICSDYMRCLVLREQAEKAIKIGEKCLHNHNIQSKSAIHYALATAYSSLGQYHQAVSEYDKCLAVSPNHLDALAYAGMMRMKLGEGHAMLGFKQFSARKCARNEPEYALWTCPVLKGDISRLNILIVGELGLGDELSCLRYLPYLLKTGARITYWGGAKLLPLLNRLDLGVKCMANTEPLPDIKEFDIAFRMHELPCAVEHYSAPEIAPPLALKPNPELVDKWRKWLKVQGDGPYIGVNWRAGVASADTAAAFKNLNKAIEQATFAACLSSINATWVSLQRNVTKAELNAFELALKAPVADAAGIADGLDDMLALQSLLDENIGVSNTNMHLRAGLGKRSRVLVQTPYGDWRWGIEGSESPWFKDCKIYRQTRQGDWSQALQMLQHDLQAQYKIRTSFEPKSVKNAITAPNCTKRLIWVTAGVVKLANGQQTSELASARYRVINPSQALAELGWKSEIVNEGISQTMGGWGDATPQPGDTVIISKVFTEHSINLAGDAKDRGAKVIVDFCDNFLAHPKRGPLQKALLAIADKVVVSTQALGEAITSLGKTADAVISDPVEFKQGEIKFSPGKVLKLMWFGHAVNIDTLAQVLPALAQFAQKTPLQLNVVTTLPNGQQDLNKIVPPGLMVTYAPWSISATEAAIADCDMVIIPTIQSDVKKAKSPNRLLEPLWAGRMVVAGRLPAYEEFADSAWVGDNLVEGIAWCLANPDAVKTRIRLGQQKITGNYSKDAIGRKWLDCISHVSNSSLIKTETHTIQPIHASAVKQLAILTTQSAALPSIAIRLVEPFTILDSCDASIASGINAKNKLQIDFEALLMRDIIIVQRDAASNDTLPLIRKLKQLGKKIIYETDDAFHLLSEKHPKAIHRLKAPAMIECAKLADVITVSTEALVKEFSGYGHVELVPNLLSASIWNDALNQQKVTSQTSAGLRIGLVGGANHRDDFALIKAAVQDIALRYPQITWVAYGESAVKLFESIPECAGFEAHQSNYNYPGHAGRLASLSLDMALVPLEDNPFNQCISNLKYLEYGFLGVPGIYSDVEAYRTSVSHEVNGLLVVADQQAWIEAMQTLIDQPSLRAKIAAQARNDVLQHWMLTPENNPWKRVLESL